MAGAVAALSARAASPGARVALVRRSPGATALSSGAVDAAPDAEALPSDRFFARRAPLDAARRYAARHPEHPYAALGDRVEQLGVALEFAAQQLPLLAPPLPRARWLATAFGTVQPCALCQRTMIAGDLASGEGPLAVVGLRGHLAFDARLVADGLARLASLGAPPVQAVELDLFMREEEAQLRPHELARALERPGAAEQAGQLLRKAAPAGTAAAIFPPILGLSPTSRVAARIQEAAGMPVAEVLGGVPSVPGIRLQAAIEAKLAEAAVELVSGSVAEASFPGQPVKVGDRILVAPAWVLATGRFIGGGVSRRGAVVEPAVGLPVFAGAVPAGGRPTAALTAAGNWALQPLLAAGVRVDHLLRPLGAQGRPAHQRLFAAGSVIGGHEPAVDGTGLGSAILTGYLAGRSALGVEG
jgi:glycerol-3-phosphate dehydrogenase subunit B